MSDEATKKSRKQYGVSPEKFVEVWQTSDSASQVAEKLGMPKNIVLARSAQYRKNNVNLKKMTRHNPRKLEAGKLNELITAGFEQTA